MKQYYMLVLTAVVILLLGVVTLSFNLAALVDNAQPQATLHPDDYSIAPLHLQPAFPTANAPEWHTFGNTADYAVFLELTSPQTYGRSQYQLTTAPVATQPMPAQPAVCAYETAQTVAPPPGVKAAVTAQLLTDSTVTQWLQWVQTSHYAVMLWAPHSQADTYTLVSRNHYQLPGNCATPVDEDV